MATTDTPNPYASPSVDGLPGNCTSDTVVEYDFTTQDWLAFSIRQNRAHQETTIRRIRRILVLLTVLTAAFAIWMWDLGFPAWLLLAIVPIFLVYRTIRVSSHYQQRVEKLLESMFTQKSNRGILGLNQLELTHTGIHGQSPGGCMDWKWWAVSDIEVTEEYLYIYTSSVSTRIIPARAFASREHFNAFARNARRLWNLHRH